MEISFTVKCNPPTQTAQACTRILKRENGSFFIGKKNNKARGELMALLRPFVPEKMFEGPVELNVEWNYAWRKSETKKNKKKGFRYCYTRPDCDNLCKQLCDAFTRLGFWKDDSLISRLVFEKKWVEEPCIKITIRDLEQ